MQLSDFAFDLPAELIAQYPLPERSGSRLLIVDGSQDSIAHAVFSELPQLLLPGDLLVVNDTRVIHARLTGTKETGGRVEVMIERVIGSRRVLARVRASKSLKVGSRVLVGASVQLRMVERQNEFCVLDLVAPAGDIKELLQKEGEVPLPPYLNRRPEPSDEERYQTIYSRQPGAVAAPTAGLHFDEKVFAALVKRGVAWTVVTLHVGSGTFQPVRTERLDEHVMHAEHVEVSLDTVRRIEETRRHGGRVIAVGTTTVRSLETAAACGELRPYCGDTRLFLQPGCPFRVVDGMITNFHLPESTLLMMVSAFSGYRRMMRAYQVAIRERYRFYSYGDAMLLWPDRSSWEG